MKRIIYSSFLVFLTLILAWQNTLPVNALSPSQKNAIDKGIYYFNTDPDACGEVNEITVIGNNNIEKAFNYFVSSKQLPTYQSAGIVGNLIVESGGELDPNVKQYSGGPGRGIVQWEVGGRWDTAKQPRDVTLADGTVIKAGSPANLMGWATSGLAPRDPFDLITQLEFLWFELQTTEKSAFDEFKTTTSVQAAAAVFMTKFERPKDQSESAQAERGRIAAGVLARYGGAGIGGPNEPTTPVSGSEMGCAGTGASVAIVDGLAFPLQVQKSTILGNNPRWCYQNQNNCHHDYNAADIFVPTGSQVVAATPGKVVNVNNGRAANVTILGADQHIYYYTHMAPNTPAQAKVKEGMDVVPGTKLGTIGTADDAQGTPPHLHFDILQKGHKYRMNCSGAACPDSQFLNVQPQLTKAFQALRE